MKNVKKLCAVIAVSMILICTFSLAIYAQNSNIWVSGYVASWTLHMGSGTDGNYGNMPYQALDLDAMTHVIMFAASIQSDGSIVYNNMVSSRRKPFNDYVHFKGKPIIMSVGGAGNTAFASAISATYRTNLVKNLMSSIRTEQYDGIDVDIEPVNASDTANIKLFIKELYDSLQTHHAYYDVSKKPLLTCAIYNYEKMWAGLSPYFDQINLMSYDFFGTWFGKSWHNNAPTSAPTDVDIYNSPMTTVQSKMQRYLNAGMPASKFGVGVDFNGYVWQGGLLADGSGNGITAPRQRWSTAPTMVGGKETQYYALRKKYIDTAATSYHYDNICKVPYIGIDNPGNTNDLYITYQDSSTVTEIINLARTNKLGGVIIWEVGGGYLGTTEFPAAQYPTLLRDPLLRAVKQAVGGTITSPSVTLPSVPTLQSPINASTAVIINPTLQWNTSAGANTYHIQVATSSSFVTYIANDSLHSSTSKQIADLEYRSSYFWRVRARNNVGYSGWSSVWSFTTDSLQIISVADNILYDDALKSPWMNASWSSTIDFSNAEQVSEGMFAMKAVQTGWGALRFRSGSWSVPVPVQLSQNQKLQFKVFSTTSGLSLRVNFSNDAAQTFPARIVSPTVGNWVVVSIPTDSLNPNSQVVHNLVIQNNSGNTVTFYIDALGISAAESPAITLAKTTLVSPVHNSIEQPTSLPLQWNAVQNALQYQLQVAKDSMFTLKVVDDSVISATVYQLSGLLSNTTYFWRVRAKSNTAIGQYSDVSKFKTMLLYIHVSLDKKSIDFGKVVVGKSKRDSILVTNSGNILANISHVLVSSTEYSITPQNFELAPGIQKKVYVTFSPTKKVTVNSKVLLLCESLNYTDTVAVTGRGVSTPKIVLNPASIALPIIPEGSSVVDSFKVYNIGEVETNIINVQSTNADFAVYPTSATIAAMDSQYFFVTISSEGNESKDGYIILQNDATILTDSMYVSVQSALGVGSEEFPKEFTLKQNYPNPFNPVTTISFQVPVNQYMTLKVYDLLGQEIATLVDGFKAAGSYEVQWNADSQPSGTYFYRLTAGSFTSVKKLLLLR
ncbi:MAG: glycosyl hydrolase family 18 protein [Bacteroidota bacterium]|nr:glycosyl hydrolase family 18 protein [Bacteroidota bacterium]